MNEINIKLTTEQIATLNKLLMPYLELYGAINKQFNEQNQKNNLDDEIESRR